MYEVTEEKGYIRIKGARAFHPGTPLSADSVSGGCQAAMEDISV